jgi:glycosyltransferase involved in cell wall biosynthesis
LEKLKILMVAHSYPPYVGGLSYVVDNLSRRLADRGHDVEVVTLDIGDGLPRLEERNGVIIRRFRGYAPAGGYFIPSRGFSEYLSIAKADVYHLHNIGALTVPVAWFAIRRKKHSYALTPHLHRSGYTWHAALLWKPYKLIAKKIIREAKVTHSVSRYEAGLIKKEYHVDPVIVPNGISEDVLKYTWKPPNDELVITYAGRMEHYKRVDDIIKTAAILANRNPAIKIQVRLIGKGPALPKALSLAGRLGVKVEHYNFLPRKEYLELLATSTVFVNLSRYEAYSIVTAEALAIGVPAVIVKPWGETFKDIPKAYIINSGTPEETAKAVLKALEAPVDSKPKPGQIPTWIEVAEKIVEQVYAKLLE